MPRHAMVLFGVTAAWVGCIPVQTVTDEGGSPVADISAWPGEVLGEAEPNDEFVLAMPALLSDPTLITGKIDSLGDHDIYALGPLPQGMRLQATIETMQAGDFSCCFFDHRQRLLAKTSVVDPEQPRTIDLLLPLSAEELYLLAFGPTDGDLHDYAATLTVGKVPEEPQYHPQVIVLNFTGAVDITVAGRFYSIVPPFDSGTIGPKFSGRTAALVQQVLAEVREDYLGLDVQIFLGSDPAIPEGPISTVHFGTSNPDLLGVADGVDPYNSRQSESAIIYTDTFALFSSLEPDEQMLVQILANVTSHEIGHLVGLRHTDDPDDLMDVTATARRLMSDQWFKMSRLHSSVCPLGYQDGPALLAWTLGGQLTVPDSATRRPIIVADTPGDFTIPRSWLCSHCPG